MPEESFDPDGATIPIIRAEPAALPALALPARAKRWTVPPPIPPRRPPTQPPPIPARGSTRLATQPPPIPRRPPTQPPPIPPRSTTPKPHVDTTAFQTWLARGDAIDATEPVIQASDPWRYIVALEGLAIVVLLAVVAYLAAR